MRRTIPAAMAVLLTLAATPVLATDTEKIATDQMTWVRMEAPEAGLSMDFPEGWRVSQLTGTRESEIRTPEGDPVFVTTAVLANGRDGRWCDVDVYLDMIAALDEHAYAYASYLQQVNRADVAMVVAEIELPTGPAFRIETFDPERARLLAMYLLDGPVADDGTVDRFLLTCAAAPDSEAFWQTIAESIELFEPASEEEPAT